MQIGVDSQRAVENKRIFVLDQDEINSMGLQFMLADEYETHVLTSIAAALDKAVSWPPDLVLLGSSYLSENVSDTMQRLRSAMPQTKIVLVGADPFLPGVLEALKQGASSVLLTPLTIENTRRRVDTALGRIAPVGIPVVPI